MWPTTQGVPSSRVVGQDNLIQELDGSWIPHHLPGDPAAGPLTAIWGTAQDVIYAAGNAGKRYRFDGTFTEGPAAFEHRHLGNHPVNTHLPSNRLRGTLIIARNHHDI